MRSYELNLAIVEELADGNINKVIRDYIKPALRKEGYVMYVHSDMIPEEIQLLSKEYGQYIDFVSTIPTQSRYYTLICVESSKDLTASNMFSLSKKCAYLLVIQNIKI